MSINSLERKVTKEIWKRKQFLKLELKKIILKSVLQNRHVKTKYRGYSMFKKFMLTKKRSTFSWQRGICLTSGKLNTSRIKFPYSRQFIKKYTDMGLLQNIKSISW